MFQRQMYFSRMDEGVSGRASFTKVEGVESSEDEMDIISDQDETTSDDRVMGGMGTESATPVSSGEFERGEIDIVDQIDRVTRVMDHATHRGVETAAPPNVSVGVKEEPSRGV
ncbi:MAG: hypothetical protein KF799_04365 [Bdellovibrionales bacterium]|nr:hypothetical protein [Bdellovibrionales bacterium]